MIGVLRRMLLHGIHRQDLAMAEAIGPPAGPASAILARLEAMRRAQTDLEARLETMRAEVRVDVPPDGTE